MADFAMAVDAGGSAVKVSVVGFDGTERAVASRSVPPLTPAPGHAERDPEAMWATVCALIRTVLDEAALGGDDIAVVGLTGYGNGLYLIDAAGRPTANGVLATDIRAADIVAGWRRDGTEAATLEACYQAFWPGKPVPLLAWFQHHRPDVLASATTLFSCKDYLRFRLTGVRAAELTDQSTAGLVSGSARARDARLLAAAGLGACERLLPPLIEPLAIAGEVGSEAAGATGLRAGTPVSAGCCDNLALMLGSGVVDSLGLVVVSGTWGLHQSFLDAPVKDGSIVLVAHGAASGQWLAIEGSPTSASAFDWFVQSVLRPIAPDLEPADLFARCATLLAEAPEGPPLLFLPFVNGAIDNSDARAALVGFATWHRLGHAVRAIFEGVSFEHRRHYERLMRHRPRPEAIHFAGGALRSAEWTRIFSASLQAPLLVPRNEELGALGAAALAGAAMGRFPDLACAVGAMAHVSRREEPDPVLQERLDRRYQLYRDLVCALDPFWAGLAP